MSAWLTVGIALLVLLGRWWPAWMGHVDRQVALANAIAERTPLRPEPSSWLAAGGRQLSPSTPLPPRSDHPDTGPRQRPAPLALCILAYEVGEPLWTDWQRPCAIYVPNASCCR